MEKNKDAYGQEVLAAFNGKESYEIVERDDGFMGLSTGAEAYFADFKQWPKWQKKAINFAKGKILDVGCGAGRVGLYLQKEGLDVTSIDNSPLAIEVCRKRRLRNTKVMPIEKVNEFDNGAFDTIIMFGNNFGLFGNFKKAKRLLKKFYKITSSNALIIAESNDPYKTNDPVHLSYHKLNKRRGRMVGQLKIRVRFKNYVGGWFDYLLVSKKEMEQILKGTGWKVKKYIESGKNTYIALIEKSK